MSLTLLERRIAKMKCKSCDKTDNVLRMIASGLGGALFVVAIASCFVSSKSLLLIVAIVGAVAAIFNSMRAIESQ